MKTKLPRLLPLLVAAATLAVALPAHAEFKVKSPIVETGEVELENAGSVGRDSRSAHDHEVSDVQELEYGVTDRWMTEIEAEWGRDPGPDGAFRYLATTWGNKFQLFEQGSQWLELGLWAEYSRATKAGGADTVKFGPLIEKSLGPTTTTINLFLEKEVGAGSSSVYDASYGAQFRYDWRESISPAIEVYGDLGDVGRLPSVNEQEHRIGPVVTGGFSLGELGAIKYNVGYLVGLTSATPQHTVKWQLEYERAF